jgi:uncharacterized protein YjdB
MSTRRRWIPVVLALVCASCTDAAAPAPEMVARVDITPASLQMNVGDVATASATPFGATSALPDRTVAWVSDNTAIATVQAIGNGAQASVRGVGAGTAVLTATSEGRGAVLTVRVNPVVASVVVAPETSSVPIGSALTLVASARDAGGNAIAGRTFAWTSSNNQIATVDAAGVVRGVSPGAVQVTATTDGRSGFSTITVTPVVASVSITPSTASTAAGSTLSLVATARDASGNAVSGRTFVWSTSSALVATVDAGGTVRGVAPGTAQISASTDGRSGSATVTITPAPFTISVTNQLVYNIRVQGNGLDLGTVFAGVTQTFSIAGTSAFVLSWDLIRPTTSTGVPTGEVLGGSFSAVANASGTISYSVDNTLGSTTYFAPLMTNSSSVGLLMVVNQGLVGELRCNCVVPPNSSRVGLGYYRLLSNTNVRAYRDTSNYTGGYVFWNYGQHFATVTAGSGAVELLNNLIPSAASGLAGLTSPLIRALIRPDYQGPLDYPRPPLR